MGVLHKIRLRRGARWCAATLAWASLAFGAAGAVAQPPVLQQTIVLPQVKGGFDLMALDRAGQRLFVNAQDNNSTEVLDVSGPGRWLAQISGLTQPKWPVYRPELNKLYIANGDGRLSIFDGKTYAPRKTLSFPEKTNNLRYAAGAHALLIGVGATHGALVVVDATTDTPLRSIALAAAPKQFEIEGDRAYVNEPSRGLVEVVDWVHGRVVAQWPLGDCENVPMDLKRADHRLLIACTQGQLLVVDARTGAVRSRTPIAKDADGVHLDPRSGRVYISANEGVLQVLTPARGGSFQEQARITTRPGAGTSLLAPDWRRLFVALPQVGAQPAEIRVYRLPG